MSCPDPGLQQLRHNAAMSELPLPRIVRAHDCRRERWRNGAGWTREILTVPAFSGDSMAGPDWAARLSIADIEVDADYSLFPGVMREQALLSGEGLRLQAGEEVHELLPPLGRWRFSGALPVRAVLVGGRVEAFNLMWRPGLVDARLLHRPLVGTMLFFCPPGLTWVVHVVAGSARLAAGEASLVLERGDTALLAPCADRRFMLDGGADLLLVRLQAQDGASVAGLDERANLPDADVIARGGDAA